MALAGATATDDVSNEPNFEGMNPSQIEKIMIEEMAKPKGSGKDGFNFTKTVGPILDNFKNQLLEDKKKMQKQLDDDIAVIQKCIKKMQKSARLGLMEVDKKKKNKCPSDKEVKKCEYKIKNLKPKQKACKELENIGKKDVDSILKLIKQWNKQKVLKKDCKLDKGETKYHYVDRLSNHFRTKLKKFEKQLKDLNKKQGNGKKLKKGCDLIKSYQRKLKVKVCATIKANNYACKCDKVIREKKMCQMFNGCYSASVRAAKNNRKEIEKKNAAAKLEWRAVGRIECLLKVLGVKKGAKPDAKKLEACVKGPQISTKPLDLRYAKIPAKPKCALKGVNKKMRQNCNKKL